MSPEIFSNLFGYLPLLFSSQRYDKIYIGSIQQASMQVALHVSKLHQIAGASNRVCDIGRIGGEVYSQEALCKVDVEKFSSSWFGGCRRQLSA